MLPERTRTQPTRKTMKPILTLIQEFGDLLNRETNWTVNHALALAEIRRVVLERIEAIDEAKLTRYLYERASCAAGCRVVARDVIMFVRGELGPTDPEARLLARGDIGRNLMAAIAIARRWHSMAGELVDPKVDLDEKDLAQWNEDKATIDSWS